MQDRDHRARGLGDDLADQPERMLRGQAEADECHVRVLAGSDRRDLADVDLARDDFMPEPDHDLGKKFQPVAPLIGDQDAQPLRLVSVRHVPPLSTAGFRAVRAHSW